MENKFNQNIMVQYKNTEIQYKITKKLTPEVINELLGIQKKKGLTAESIINSAREENNPLHNLFEWNDSIAGEKYRLVQARILVNEVKVIIENKEYYAFENVSINSPFNINSQDREYIPVVEILDNETLKQQIIKSALNHLAYWEKQNSNYSELSPIIITAKKVREELEKKWQKKQ